VRAATKLAGGAHHRRAERCSLVCDRTHVALRKTERRASVNFYHARRVHRLVHTFTFSLSDMPLRLSPRRHRESSATSGDVCQLALPEVSLQTECAHQRAEKVKTACAHDTHTAKTMQAFELLIVVLKKTVRNPAAGPYIYRGSARHCATQTPVARSIQTTLVTGQ
jgi:hypothetical protein